MGFQFAVVRLLYSIEEAANSSFPNFIATHEEHGIIVIRCMDYYHEYQKLL